METNQLKLHEKNTLLLHDALHICEVRCSLVCLYMRIVFSFKFRLDVFDICAMVICLAIKMFLMFDTT